MSYRTFRAEKMARGKQVPGKGKVTLRKSNEPPLLGHRIRVSQ